MEISRIGRREFLRLAGIAGAALVGAACAPAASPASTPTKAAGQAGTGSVARPPGSRPEEVRAELYEAAKKEGQLVFYATGTAKEVDEYRKVFSKTYPGIELKDFTSNAQGLYDKLLPEFKAGRVNADCVLTNLDQWVPTLKEGFMEKWQGPEASNFPAEAMGPTGHYVISEVVVHVISYNTKLVPAADAPKNYEDLLKPIFKGRLGLEQNGYGWLTSRMSIWGREKALDYARRLATQRPTLISGYTTLADAVVSGEVWAAVNVYQHRVEQQKATGAPVEWAADNPTSSEGQGIGVTKGAPHPNAGKLFADWRLTAEAQQITLNAGRYPVRKGMVIPQALQVNLVLPTLEIAAEVPNNVAIFKEIFGMV